MSYKIKIIVISSLVFFGCSQKPVYTPALVDAQKSYERVKEDQQISSNAPVQLFEAGKIYSLTQNAKTEQEANHLAYMLLRQIDLAKEELKTQELEDSIKKLKNAKTQALLDEKESQLILLQKEAQKARIEAQKAIDEAYRAKQEARVTKQKLIELQELNAKQTNRGLVLTLGDVLFQTGRSTLLSGSKRAIDKLAEFLDDNKERIVLIEGHTDNIGSITSNLDLSLRRAGAVQEALIQKGIDEQRLFVKGYGEAYPVASNDNQAGRQRNRRVEIVILEEGADPSQMMREAQD